MNRRVAVTGLGVVAPGGIGVPAFWDLLTSGRTATRGITLFDPEGFRSRIAAECDFDAAACGLDPVRAARADRYVQFALAGAAEAVRDSGLDLAREDPWRVGVSLGSAVGGTTRLERDYVAVSSAGSRWDVDHREAAPDLHRAFSPSTLASEVAEHIDAHGPVQTVSTGCTSGLDAVGYAFHMIAEGKADIAIVLISDIHHKDAKLVGSLPEAIQLWTVYAAAIPASSTEPANARAFIAALTGADMRKRWTDSGFEPVAQ